MGALQKNDNGALIMLICFSDDPDLNGSLISDCTCCECDPPLKRVYTATVSTDISFSWAACNRYVDEGPHSLTYRVEHSAVLCRWKSPDISGYPIVSISMIIWLRWDTSYGGWYVKITGINSPGSPTVACPDNGSWDLYQTPKPTDHCDPFGSYVAVVTGAGAGGADVTITTVIS